MTVEQRPSCSPPSSPMGVGIARSASFTFPTSLPPTPPSTPLASSSPSSSPFSLSLSPLGSWLSLPRPATWTVTWREAVVTVCILAQLLVITQVATWVSPGAPMDPGAPSRLMDQASLSAHAQAAAWGVYQGAGPTDASSSSSLPTGRRALEDVGALQGARLAAARGVPGVYPAGTPAAGGDATGVAEAHGSRKWLWKKRGGKRTGPAASAATTEVDFLAASAMTSAVTSSVTPAVDPLQAGKATVLDGEQPFLEEGASAQQGHVALPGSSPADVVDAGAAPADVAAHQEVPKEQTDLALDAPSTPSTQEQPKQEEQGAQENKAGEQKEGKAAEGQPSAEGEKQEEPEQEEHKAEEQPKKEETDKEAPGQEQGQGQGQGQEQPKQGEQGVSGSQGAKEEEGAADACAGRRVFVYDYLPSKFHQDLITNCSNPCDNLCDNLCPTLERDGLGSLLQEPEGEAGKALFTDSYDGKTYEFKPWLGTQQNMVGVLFRGRMGGYECRTSDWEKADAFYIPALFGLKTLYGSQLPFQEIEAMGDELERFLAYQPGFLRHGGRDHFLVVGQQYNDFMCRERNDPKKDWSWCSYLYYRPALANVTLISVERPFWEQRIQSVPYLTAFHPGTDAELKEWLDFVKDHPRPHKVTLLAGRRSNVPVRKAVLAACEAKGGDACRFVDCSGECPRGSCRKVVGVCGEPRLVAKEYLSSTFCLMPNGDSATRRSIFDALIAGCIPVHFDPDAFDRQYPWHHGDPQRVSVLFDKEATQNGTLDFLAALQSISGEKLAQMQRNVRDLIPSLVFRDHTRGPAPSSASDSKASANASNASDANAVTFKDAFDLAVQGILKHLVSPVTYQM